jgi:aminoglycoside phosphotransferase (APT) family kinase protein
MLPLEDQIATLVRSVFPRHRIACASALAGGLRNSNFKVELDPNDEGPLVLRIYEHDPALCRKEIDLHRLVRETVPVPEILHAQPDHRDRPFVLMRFVEGSKLGDLTDADAIAQAASSVGEALAAIGTYTFAKSGWIEAGPLVTSPLLEGSDPCPRFIDECLASTHLEARMEARLRDQVHELGWSWASRLASVDDGDAGGAGDDRRHHLVHCDYSARNILVHPSPADGRWRVVAVLDWEFAVSASPLIDVGNFLRYEHRRASPRVEPHFSEAFARKGGFLPNDWQRLARVLDLTALCEMLARPTLPEEMTAEVLALVRATVEDCAVSRSRI